jgi:hypothetical protein
MKVKTDLLMSSKVKTKNNAKVHTPDRIKKKIQKGTLHWSSRPPVFIGVNRVEMLVLLLPHVRQREFLAWDGQIGPVILGGVPLTIGWWDPAVCPELFVNVDNLGYDPLSTSEL